MRSRIVEDYTDKREFNVFVMADLIGHLCYRFPVKQGMTVKSRFCERNIINR